MSRQLISLMLVPLFACSLALAAGTPAPPSSGPAATQATTKAATRPAVDRSSPEKTWAAICAAIKAGDLVQFRGSFFGRNELSRLFMDAYSDLTVTTLQLSAATAVLGDEGKALSKKLKGSYTEIVKSGQNRKTDITGDTARWRKDEAAEPDSTDAIVYFRKVDGQWLIDTEKTYGLDTPGGRQTAEDFLDSSVPQLKALKAVLEGIRTQKITTVEQMRAKLAEKAP